MSPDQIHTLSEEAKRDHEAALRGATERIDQMIAKIQAAGGQAEGEVGVDDPLEATEAALERHSGFDKLIVSTLPAGLSRWVKMDLPHRIARPPDVPVTTVEAEAEPE